MRPNEHIPSCLAIANPGTGRVSPAGREPNPILIAEHRSQEPLGITARVASLGTVPSQHSAEPPPSPPGLACPEWFRVLGRWAVITPRPRGMPAARSPRAGNKVPCDALPAAPPPDCMLCKAKFPCNANLGLHSQLQQLSTIAACHHGLPPGRDEWSLSITHWYGDQC